ncbi:MAG: 3-keto-disaccharide hydrolase [Pseudomonadota bacterium]
MIQRRDFLNQSAAWLGLALTGVGAHAADQAWTTLLDTSRAAKLDDWVQLGEGNWTVTDQALQGKDGKAGFLVSKGSYKDFELRVEFWADEAANSGVFIRAADPKKIGADSSYEVNIFDKRPDPSYGTGGIPNVAKVAQPGPKAANQWNTYEITARGDHLVVVLNGHKTVDVRDGKFAQGPFALQSAGGTIRFRKIQIRQI